MVGLALVAAGCASTPSGTAPAAPADEVVWIGRLGWHLGAEPGRTAQQASAGFELRGNAQDGSLELSTPLGTLLARARWQPAGAELHTPDGLRRFNSLAQLSQAAFGGGEVPLDALFDWLRGRPSPRAAHEPRHGGFAQLGWSVDVSALGQGLLTASRTAEPAITLRVRLEPPQ